jgi:hypothetical protein
MIFPTGGGSTHTEPEHGVEELAKETLEHKHAEESKAMSGKIDILAPSPMSVLIVK